MMGMQQLAFLTPAADLSGAWCDTDLVTSSLMEATSFITPVLEKFFIRTVTEALDGQHDPAMALRCRAFIREEAVHSYAHKRLNTALLAYLHSPPPGSALVQTLLDKARRHLSLTSRLLLAAALEHFAAVLSKGYLAQAGQWAFACPYSQALFAQHAQEELGHRSVVFDLWFSRGRTSCGLRMLTVWVVLLVGLVYLAIALPWILYHKHHQHWLPAVSACIGLVAGKPLKMASRRSLHELFLFAHSGYHPDSLVAASIAV